MVCSLRTWLHLWFLLLHTRTEARTSLVCSAKRIIMLSLLLALPSTDAPVALQDYCKVEYITIITPHWHHPPPEQGTASDLSDSLSISECLTLISLFWFRDQTSTHPHLSVQDQRRYWHLILGFAPRGPALGHLVIEDQACFQAI